MLPATAPTSRSEQQSDDSDCEIIEKEDEEEKVKILEQIGGFEEVVVWGHEALPAADDVFVKGVGEWVAFAEAVSFGSLSSFVSSGISQGMSLSRYQWDGRNGMVIEILGAGKRDLMLICERTDAFPRFDDHGKGINQLLQERRG